MTSEANKVLNEHEAASLLSLSVATLRAWRHHRKGPRFIRFGRAVRYLQADIEAFINAHVIEVGDKK